MAGPHDRRITLYYCFILIHVRAASAVIADGGVLAAGASAFLAPGASGNVSTAAVVFGIQQFSEGLARSDPHSQRRRDEIEMAISGTMQALPKNHLGRLEASAVRYVVHGFFLKAHGWRIESLEPGGAEASDPEVHGGSVLQEKMPRVLEAVLEEEQLGRGLAYEQVVLMIAVLERLILDESLAMLPRLYHANGFEASQVLDEDGVQELLVSHLMAFRGGLQKKSLESPEYHMAYKERRMTTNLFQHMMMFAEDILINYEYRNRNRMNPFELPWYDSTHVSEILQDAARAYGQYQNHDCRAMKEQLIALSAPGTGRLPLRVFHEHESDGSYNLRESIEYLRSIDALDGSDEARPQVRLANYVLGPSNCIARSAYFSVCCINECDFVMEEIEAHTGAPRASPEFLLGVASNISTASVDGPRQLTRDLETKIRRVAELNEGSVPIHGRLFSQWLHFAFPNECPYPTADATMLLASRLNANYHASEAEIRSLRNGRAAAPGGLATATGTISEMEWSDEESLPLHRGEGAASARSAVDVFVKGVLVCLVLRGVWVQAAAGLRAHAQLRDPTKIVQTV